MAVRQRDVRLTDANAIKQISTVLTCVTAASDSGDICENSRSPNDDLDEDEDVAYESDDRG